jgi:uncharacterized protein YndB with AHSA1/START domain
MAKTQTSPETTLQLKRTFAAPRDRVFRAWTDASILAQWFAPSPEYVAVVPEFEFRVGGRYRFEMHHKGGNVHRVYGTYREIDAPEKLAFTWHWESDQAQESVVTIEFRELGPSSTEMILTHENLPSTEERDKHSYGWNGCLDQLETLLAKQL